MRRSTRIGLVWFATALLLGACAPSRPAAAPEGDQQVAAKPTGSKRITAVIRSAPPDLAQLKRQRGGGLRGLDGLEQLTNAGLTYIKADGTRAAQLAEAVPTVDNGLWKLLPDGRMETTWKIKPAARWHDGTPFSADDLVFTRIAEQDKELEVQAYAEYDLIESIGAPDSRTLTVVWKRPFIDADGIFSYGAAGVPMPKHLLEKPYTEDKTSFLGLPYWTEEFVGLGAFTMREWARDSYTLLRAFDGYIFGRPKIDEIEVRFIPDNNALLANMLAGGDLTLGKTISLDMALGAQEQWKEGRVAILPQNWTPLNPQFINADPPIVTNFQFRRAMIEALDRQQLADFVFSGQGSIAHSYVAPDTPLYNLVEPSIVKYEYDPRHAAQLIEGLGYTKRPDGFFYDGAGRKLAVEIRIPIQNDIHAKTAAPVADMWQQLGVAVDQVPVPIQRTLDREYRTQFPGFQVVERVNSLAIGEIWRFHSSQVPLPENGFRATGFESRYRHPDVDAFLERYATTIPMPDRMAALAGLVHHQTENLSQLPLFHGADPTLISNRLLNVTARGADFTQPWNVEEWDLRY
jgi:peptide/nickel transport system substrate-binding protein